MVEVARGGVRGGVAREAAKWAVVEMATACALEGKSPTLRGLNARPNHLWAQPEATVALRLNCPRRGVWRGECSSLTGGQAHRMEEMVEG